MKRRFDDLRERILPGSNRSIRNLVDFMRWSLLQLGSGDVDRIAARTKRFSLGR